MSGATAKANFPSSTNQTGSLFSIVQSDAVRIFNSDPLVEKLRMTVGTAAGDDDAAAQRKGKMVMASVLGRSNYMAYVSAGEPSTVCLYDDLKQRVVLRFVEESRIKGVVLEKRRLVVVLLTKVKVYDWNPLAPCCLFTFPTMTNDDAIAVLAPLKIPGDDSKRMLAFLGRNTGQVQFCQIPAGDIKDAIETPVVSIVAAHTAPMKCIALNSNGALLATASNAGTLVRVFDTKTRALLHEFRRGTEAAIIYSLAFSMDDYFLVVGSDRGTVHIFVVGAMDENSALSLERRGASAGAGASPPNNNSAFAHQKYGRKNPDAQNGGFPSSRSVVGGGVGGAGGGASSAPPSIASISPVPLTGVASAVGKMAYSQASKSSGASGISVISTSGNRGSSLGFLAPINKYFKSQWSFAQCSVESNVAFVGFFGGQSDPDLKRLKADLHDATHPQQKMQMPYGAQVASPLKYDSDEEVPTGFEKFKTKTPELETLGDSFKSGTSLRWSPPVVSPTTSIIILTQDGSYYKFALDVKKGGECVLEKFYKLTDLSQSVERIGETEVGGVRFGMAVR
ncbi:WD repeat domain phosphoinositide-interacting protein 3 [Chytriomyces hyalinus]|nr:WD repeat domain phosphoinositide-interacting protein 3 [Chytriomyces hyalinus]